MAGIGYLGSPYCFAKLVSPIGIGIRPIRFNFSYNSILMGKCATAFEHGGLLHSGRRIGVPYGGIGLVPHFLTYLCAPRGKNGNRKIEAAAVPSDGSFGGNAWLNNKLACPDLLQMIGIFAFTCAFLFAFMMMPKIVTKLYEYQDPAILLSRWSSLLGLLLNGKCFLGALDPPFRYLMTFITLSYMVAAAIPSTIASKYIRSSWKGAIIISLFWFLHRWKSNIMNHVVEIREGVDRDDWLTLDKVSSIGLILIVLMVLAGAYGFAVQSILTVGGIIGGVATIISARDVLGNILGDLSMQISEPFSIGDRIKVGLVEGTVEKRGISITTLLTTKEFPVIGPNYLFSRQVGSGEGTVEKTGYSMTKLLTTKSFPVIVPNSFLSHQAIVNESRAPGQEMVIKIPFKIGNFGNISKISEDIETHLKSNTNALLEEEAPYCVPSGIEGSYAELALRCNINTVNEYQQFSARQDILMQCVQIIKQHGGTLG